MKHFATLATTSALTALYMPCFVLICTPESSTDDLVYVSSIRKGLEVYSAGLRRHCEQHKVGSLSEVCTANNKEQLVLKRFLKCVELCLPGGSPGAVLDFLSILFVECESEAHYEGLGRDPNMT
jgi:hypothetical protein